jgi:hypothetical protein
MTNRVAGKLKSTSSLQSQVGLLVKEGLVDQKKERILIPSRGGRTLQRSIIVYHLNQEKWFDVFQLLFSSADTSLEAEWNEWEESDPRHSDSFRQQRRREFLASDFAQKAINENFKELRDRVFLRWWDFWASHYAYELSTVNDEDSGWLMRNWETKIEALMKLSRSMLNKAESDEQLKTLVTLASLSPSSMQYLMQDDPKHRVVPLFLLDIKQLVDEWVDEKHSHSTISRRVARDFGNAFNQVIVIESMHDIMAMPLELAGGAKVDMKEMLEKTAVRSDSLLGSLLTRVEGENPNREV